MTMKRTIVFLLLLMCVSAVWAQKKKTNNKEPQEKKEKTTTEKEKKNEPSNLKATPSNMWEVGVHGGYLFASTDITTKGGYGAGVHVRKALDYIFSLRGEAIYGKTDGEVIYTPEIARSFSNDWLSGNVMGIININSLRFNKPVRPVNLYVGAGIGVNYFQVQTTRESSDTLDRRPDTINYEREIHPQVGAMVGIAFRLGKRFNVALEHQANFPLGARADLIDGFDRDETGARTGFGDILQYSSVRLNFNIGGGAKNSEPLYWINPLENVLADISEMKKNQDVAIKDSDGDGVIDAIDQEPSTAPDIPVDTKGRTLDSDRDGVPDHKDKEPYNPPRAKETVNNEGIVTNPNAAERPGGAGGAGGGVSEDRVREIVTEELSKYNLNEGGAIGVADWFLPMIHFGTDSYTIKYSDYGTLSGIARMLKGNAKLRLVITGFTDQTGPEETNRRLSYLRAQTVIDHFVETHGIGRGRLVLQWKGPEEALVPKNASYMNRRVEFRVATGEDVEMDPPTGVEAKKKDGY